MDHSNTEGLTATAGARLIGITILEAFVKTFTDIVQFSTVDVRQALGVNDHLNTKGLPNLVVCFDDIGELKLVSHARTTGGLHTQTKANALAAGENSLLYLG